MSLFLRTQNEHSLACKIIYVLLVVLSANMLVHAADTNPQEQSLKAQISAADKQFFDAFNRCDIEVMATMFSPDLEFYHDLAGLSDYQQTMAQTKINCQRKLGLTRRLIEASHKVYPLKDQGAIQKGAHEFCHPENGKLDCGTFEFVNIWKRTNGQWQMHRVISFAH